MRKLRLLLPLNEKINNDYEFIVSQLRFKFLDCYKCQVAQRTADIYACHGTKRMGVSRLPICHN